MAGSSNRFLFLFAVALLFEKILSNRSDSIINSLISSIKSINWQLLINPLTVFSSSFLNPEKESNSNSVMKDTTGLVSESTFQKHFFSNFHILL